MDYRRALSDALDFDLRRGVPSFPGIAASQSDDAQYPGCSVRHFAAVALGRSIWKKFQDEIDQASADKAALDLFSEINEGCGRWSPNYSALGPYDEIIVGEFKRTLWDFFNPEGMPLLEHAGIASHADFGPGTGPGAEDTSFYTKLASSRLTAVSPLIVEMFYEWVRSKETRLDCEIARIMSQGLPEVGCITRITPVPKTTKISRLVKTEPLLNMFFQKGVQKLLEDRLVQVFGIDFSTQSTLNAELARIGSETQTYATIDLKSASDFISRRFCKSFLPADSYRWLDLLRSHKAEMPDGTVVKLNMMATMGNAFCFPLQTVIFACMVKAVYSSLGLPLRRGKAEFRWNGYRNTFERTFYLPNYGVFGDDIVVHWEAYESLLRLLSFCGFKVNTQKSYTAPSPFRESCGADYYHGANVRGVYCTSLKTVQDRYVLINNLVDWSARTNIKLPTAVRLLLGSVRRIEVPPWDNPDAGIRMPLACVRTADVFRAVRPDKHGRHYQGSYLYKRYVPRALKVDIDKLQQNGGNPSGIYLAVSKGMAQGGSFALRTERPRYALRFGVAPCWDYLPDGDPRERVGERWYALSEGYFLEQEKL